MQAGGTGFFVSGSSGKEYLVDFSHQSRSEVVIAGSDDVPVDTTVVLTGSSITTIVVGSNTFSVSYDADGAVADVTLDPSSTRRTQEIDSAGRRLQSCEVHVHRVLRRSQHRVRRLHQHLG